MWSISLRWHHISFSNFRFFFSVRSAGRSWIQNSIYWHSPDSLVIYVAKWIIPLFRYLSRHKPEDPALRPGFKYTGFLIVRVDRDDSVREEILRQSDPFFSRRKKVSSSKTFPPVLSSVSLDPVTYFAGGFRYPDHYRPDLLFLSTQPFIVLPSLYYLRNFGSMVCILAAKQASSLSTKYQW